MYAAVKSVCRVGRVNTAMPGLTLASKPFPESFVLRVRRPVPRSGMTRSADETLPRRGKFVVGKVEDDGISTAGGCGGGEGTTAVGSDPERRPLRVTLIEGHGSGPVECASVRRIFKAAGVPVQWDVQTVHVRRDHLTGRLAVNDEVLSSAKETGLVLRGPDMGLAQDALHGSTALTLHKALNTFIGVRLFASIEGYQPFGPVRMINIRDNVSGEYSEIEHTVAPGVVQSIKTITKARSEAVAKFAFGYAVAHGYFRVTALHKANVMRLADNVFLQACRRISEDYPDVDYNELKLDTFCLGLFDAPGRYDVLLTPSMYGALAGAACSSLAGGASVVPSAAYGPDVAVFSTMADDGTTCVNHQQTYSYHHDFGSDLHQHHHHDEQHDVENLIKGRHPITNPTGLIRSAVWMLNHAGLADHARRINLALLTTVRQGVRTRDMNGNASCAQFTDAVIKNLFHDTGPCSV